MSALLVSLLVALQALQPGTPLERDLAGGESHGYTITLAAGDLLAGAVEQLGVDVVVVLMGPDGAEIEKIDSPNGTKGPEPIRTIVAAAGEYRVEVRSLEKTAAA